ncbi:nucleoside triphosphate pyrophosphohydrolase [Dethiothermospora halolimnae]|uniref:nucleoside triphosphate pyrophosphohydrolase n=1 Tax=Dethiothermospora halolimnae TaxID=3114390 RepID=UPI003CCC0C9A
MGKIVVVGLGPGDIESLTLGAIRKIEDENRNYLRTEMHPTVEYLKDNNIDYESYDYIYESAETMESVYDNITEDLLKKVKEYNIINYFVPGNPLMAEKSVSILVELSNKGEIDLEIIPGMSFIDPIVLALGHDPTSGFKIIDGLDFNEQTLDINCDTLLVQVYNRQIASDTKIKLSEVYGDDYKVTVIRSAGIETEEIVKEVNVYELDRLEFIDHLTSIYIPKVDKTTNKVYDINNLLNIMGILRSEDGCLWDIKQTHESLREYVIEEAYEVVDAIDRDDIGSLIEELGDLLLQVVFHSQIAKEEGYFNIMDVTTGISNKLIYRHPHVFNDKIVNDDKEAIGSWNDMKDKEKNIKSYTERLESVAKSLPSLTKSFKVQKRAADVGFDWDNVDDALLKVKEELQELLEVYKGDDMGTKEEELGDLLFAIVNVSRFLDISPEVALNKTINKFISRFKFIEEESNKKGIDLKEMTLKQMDELWEQAKKQKK